MDDLLACIGFLLSADLIIEADRLYVEAIRCERFNPPWARNRRRRADKLMAAAVRLCGDKGLPWGVV